MDVSPVSVAVPVHPAAPALPPAAADPVALHPALWRASQLGRPGREIAWATGFAALDGVLPGGGWPAGALTELLLPHPGVGEWRLLAPVLAAVQRGGAGRGTECPAGGAARRAAGRAAQRAAGRGAGAASGAASGTASGAASGATSGAASTGDGVARPVMLFGPPGRPCAWTLPALGLDLGRLVIVQGRGQPRGRGARVALPLAAQDLLWALEQALASGQVGAALAWLPPRLPADALRRLQLAAQSHPGPVFLFREVEARSRPSAAPLRLQLAPGAPDELLLRIVKRRGPPLDTPLALALPPVLSAPARARALAQAPAGLRAAPGAQPAPAAA